MGRNKARLRLNGRSLLRRSSEAANALRLPIRVIRRDLVPRCGPVGGILTALRTLPFESLLFLSCDMPHVEPGLLHELFSATKDRPNHSVWTESHERVGFPFIIPKSSLTQVEAFWIAGERALQSLAFHLNAFRWSPPPAMHRQLTNINTPESWIEFSTPHSIST